MSLKTKLLVIFIMGKAGLKKEVSIFIDLSLVKFMKMFDKLYAKILVNKCLTSSFPNSLSIWDNRY